MMEHEMKPCPFCGGPVKPHPGNKDYYICIHNGLCFILNPSNENSDEWHRRTLISKTERYIKEWNRRS